ncbi:MAG TPA: helix-turn-helix transcriptional regulator [Thermomicrobiales bacterium]|nr:helix-turn-helix transcriptional regulator [Thermomicrobiales bacterium]
MGTRIRELRIERGLSLSAFAERTGISPGHLSRIERGITAPSFIAGAALANALGVTADALAVESRSQRARNKELVATLVNAGMDPEIADEIQSVISTTAREQLVHVLVGRR